MTPPASPGGTSAAAPPGTAAAATAALPPCPDPASPILRQQLAQLVMVAVDGGSDSAVRRLVSGETPLGGVFVGGNGTRVLTSGVLEEVAGAGSVLARPLVAVDEEGGRVQRVDGLKGRLPSAREMGGWSADRVEAAAAARGAALRGYGVTVDFAPVVDLGGQPAREVIGDRAFAEDPADVARLAGAFAAGLRGAGVLPTLKHFPGHGRAQGDSHRTLPTTPPWESMQAKDVAPYRELLKEHPVAVMVGHLNVPGLTTDGVPSSLSPAVYDYLRNDLGFDGIVFTDELSGMRAVSTRYTTAESVRRALAAGADVALLAALPDREGLLDSLEAAVGRGDLPGARVLDAVRHVLAAKGAVGLCRPAAP